MADARFEILREFGLGLLGDFFALIGLSGLRSLLRPPPAPQGAGAPAAGRPPEDRAMRVANALIELSKEAASGVSVSDIAKWFKDLSDTDEAKLRRIVEEELKWYFALPKETRELILSTIPESPGVAAWKKFKEWWEEQRGQDDDLRALSRQADIRAWADQHRYWGRTTPPPIPPHVCGWVCFLFRSRAHRENNRNRRRR